MVRTRTLVQLAPEPVTHPPPSRASLTLATSQFFCPEHFSPLPQLVISDSSFKYLSNLPKIIRTEHSRAGA